MLMRWFWKAPEDGGLIVRRTNGVTRWLEFSVPLHNPHFLGGGGLEIKFNYQ